MTKLQLALVVIIPLSIVVLLTAANRFWDWPTQSLRLPLGFVSGFLLVLYFSRSKAGD